MGIKKTLKDNKGVTIMELLLVIGISLLILVFLLISYNVVNNANVTKASKRLETVLKNARVLAMSRGQAAGRVDITVENGRVFATTALGTTNEKKELICNANVILSVGNGAAPAVGTASMPAVIAFNPNGRLRDSVTTGDFFLLSKGTKIFKVVVYKDTGSVECKLYTPAAEPTPADGT